MQDKVFRPISGFVYLVIFFLIVGFSTYFAILSGRQEGNALLVIMAAVLSVAALIGLCGLHIISPNQAKVIQCFGNYVGTLKDVGFYWTNPFYNSTRVSLRMQTFETGQITTPEQKEAGTGKVLQSAATYRGQPSKVNDKDGTPIEIAAVVVYRIVDAAQSVFTVDDIEVYIHMQSEAVLRDIASHYSYDAHEGEQYALRGHIEEVSGRLKTSLQERMQAAGVEVMDARISHLAYATEIAGAMLQRQQASATIAARQKIVEGAVGMVELAIHSLEQKGVVTLDPERKAALVSNLLVVLCGHSTPQPIVNTGTGR